MTQTIEAHRAQRRFTFFSTFRQDLQYAVRTLIRAPGFAIVAVLTLAIGILGNTTIFSGANALLYTPLPTERPEQIAQILSGGGDGRSRNMVKHTYKRYPASTPIEVGIHHVACPRFFPTMGFPIVAGRDFDERDAVDATPVAILSSAQAVRLFGSDRKCDWQACESSRGIELSAAPGRRRVRQRRFSTMI